MSAASSRPDARLLETMQAGRETSALLSTLPGPNLSFFQAPSPPQLAYGQRTFAAPVPPYFEPKQGAFSSPAGAIAPAGTGSGQAAAALPRAAAPLLEAEQQGRIASALLSGLTGSTQGLSGISSFSRPPDGALEGSPLASMRTAQEILQALSTAPPSAQKMRIAGEAYQMEAQAQRRYQLEQAAGPAARLQWFA